MPTNRRPLAPHELGMELLNRCNGSLNIVTVSRIKGHLKPEVVKWTLACLTARHPFLRARIVGELNNLSFELLEEQEIPLRILSLPSGKSWHDIAVEELNQKIASDLSLARVTICYPDCEPYITYLITTTHHSISDALCCLNFHQEILEYAGEYEKTQKLVKLETLPILPSLSKLLPQDEFISQSEKKSQPANFIYLNFEEITDIESRQCGLVQRTIKKEQTQALIKKCKQEKTSVQGVLLASMSLALKEKINRETKEEAQILCRTSVDLRRRLSPNIPEEHWGFIASAIETEHRVQRNQILWELSREIQGKVHESCEQGLMFKNVKNFQKGFEDLIKNPNQVSASIHLTNVGQVKIKENYGSWELEEIFYLPSYSAFAGIFFAAVATYKGKMLINFLFSKPSISEETIEELADKVIFYLTQISDY